MDPKACALEACLAVAIAEGRLDLGLRDYGRRTGISARMLVHHFGSKDGLEAAMLAEVEAQLRKEAARMLSGTGGLADALTFVRSPDQASIRRLLRLLLGRALSGNVDAARRLAEERQHWREMLARSLPASQVEAALFALVGGALDAILADL